MNRKLFLVSCGFVVGTVVGQTAGSWFYGLWIMLALFVLQRGKPHIALVAAVIIAVGLGVLNGSVRQPERLEPSFGSWVGRAISQPELTAGGWHRGQFILEQGKHRVVAYASEPWNSRDIVHITGELAPPLTAQNPGEFDYQAHLIRQGVNGVIFASHIKPTARYRATPIEVMREWVAANLQDLSRQPRALASALILGDRSGFTRDEQDLWRKAGASHLLAVSGLHISIVGGLIYIGFRRFSGFRVAWIVASMGVVLYAALIGQSLSAWRAALTFVLVAIAHVALRTPDWMTTFSFVAALMLIFVPQATGDPGYQLSFIAASGIVHLSPVFAGLSKSKKIPRVLVGALVATLAAQLATLPIIINHFHTVPIYALVSSLLLVPLAPVLLVLGFLAALTGFIPVVGIAVAGLFSLVAAFYALLVAWIAGWPLATVSVMGIPILFVLVYYFLLVLWPMLIKRGVRMASAFIVLGLALSLSIHPLFNTSQLTITFLSVGNADAIHLKLSSGHYLIDVADNSAANRVVVPYLRSQGVNGLKGIFITHTHNDHTGGLAHVVNSVRVAQIYTGPELHETKVLSADVPVMAITSNMRIESPSSSITAYMSVNQRLNLNNRSAVLVLEHGELRVLFTGDLEAEGEAQLVSLFLPSQVLKVGHHGSSTSTGSTLIATVRPELAVISTGPNRYGHPSMKVMEALEESGAITLRTDQYGAVRMRLRGNRLIVESFTQGRFRLVDTIDLCPISVVWLSYHM